MSSYLSSIIERSVATEAPSVPFLQPRRASRFERTPAASVENELPEERVERVIAEDKPVRPPARDTTFESAPPSFEETSPFTTSRSSDHLDDISDRAGTMPNQSPPDRQPEERAPLLPQLPRALPQFDRMTEAPGNRAGEQFPPQAEAKLTSRALLPPLQERVQQIQHLLVEEHRTVQSPTLVNTATDASEAVVTTNRVEQPRTMQPVPSYELPNPRRAGEPAGQSRVSTKLESTPEVHISIGRIEIKVPQPKKKEAAPKPRSTITTLEEYLDQQKKRG